MAYLFDLSEVVLSVLVQDELAKGSQWELGVRPNFSQVKDVVTEALGLLWGHCLLQGYIQRTGLESG